MEYNDKFVKYTELLELQMKYRTGIIKDEDLTYDQIILLNRLYDMQMNKMEEENEAAQTTTVSTMSERDLFARLVMAEAGGEDLIGQIMVANVVLNRVNCAYGGDTTITDVIYRSGQFEPVSTGRIWSVTPTASVYEAVDRALAGEDYSNGALYFISAYCDASWFESALTCVAEHGGHVFYK